MDAILTKDIRTTYGTKTISVYACDIAQLDEHIDIMTVSAFFRSYSPTPGTLIRALDEHGINVKKLSENPAADLREVGNIWISQKISETGLPIDRIGCVELIPFTPTFYQYKEEQILSTIRAYFKLLDTMAVLGIDAKTIGIPVFGGGNQHVDTEFIAIPIINECMQLLKSNQNVNRILIITNNPKQAFQMATALNNSYSVFQENLPTNKRIPSEEKRAFISYSSKDGVVADTLCTMLEQNGIRVWYAPRDICTNDYATSIVNAILECSHFIVILSKNSVQSNHVLNEIDLAFRELHRNIKFLPIKIDEEELRPAFMYYLSRQHWKDANKPPLVARLDEFVESIVKS